MPEPTDHRLLTAPEPEPELDPTLGRHLSPDEVADRLGTDRACVYSRAELLGAVKLGRRTMRIRESNLADYLESCRVGDDKETGLPLKPLKENIQSKSVYKSNFEEGVAKLAKLHQAGGWARMGHTWAALPFLGRVGAEVLTV